LLHRDALVAVIVADRGYAVDSMSEHQTKSQSLAQLRAERKCVLGPSASVTAETTVPRIAPPS
jgi:hypothetical protein